MSEKAIIIDFVRKELTVSKKGAHTLDHILRVNALSTRIGGELPISHRILQTAALLHDVGRPREEESGISHSILSGEMSRSLLGELAFTDSEIDQIIDAIRTHRFSEGIEPRSLEGKVLSDADKLDAMGAVGIYRAIAQAESKGGGMMRFLQHADEKLLKLKDLMYTAKGKELAIERHNVLQRFVNELQEDLAVM